MKEIEASAGWLIGVAALGGLFPVVRFRARLISGGIRINGFH